MLCAIKIAGFIMFILGLGIILGQVLPCPVFIAAVLIALGVLAVLK